MRSMIARLGLYRFSYFSLQVRNMRNDTTSESRSFRIIQSIASSSLNMLFFRTTPTFSHFHFQPFDFAFSSTVEAIS